MRACVRVFPHILHTYTNLYTRAHSRRNGRSPCVHVSRCFAMHFVFLCPYVPLSIHTYKHIQRIHTCAPSVSMCVWLHACMHVRHAMHLFLFLNKMNFLFEGFKLHFVWHLNQVLGLGKGRGSRCVRMCLLVCGIHV